MEAPIGFKEWQVVCDALASGRQAVILRKGGIHEGRAGFSFAHSEFYLFPTRFHAQAEHVREGITDPMPEWQPGDSVTISHHVEAVWATTLTDWEKVHALEPYHIIAEESVRQRFDWEGKGMATGSIHVALVRVRKLAKPWSFPYEPKYGGCRSWLNLPQPPADILEGAEPVLTDEAFATIVALVEEKAGK